MKTLNPSPVLFFSMLALLPMGTSAYAAENAANQKALSAADVDHISERIRHTGDEMRAELKKARERFEAQEVERKQAAERARLQAIKDKERQAKLAAEQRQQQLAAQAKAERERKDAEQAKLLAERKKPVVLAAQTTAAPTAKDSTDDLQARKLRAAEALKKMRAASEPKAF